VSTTTIQPSKEDLPFDVIDTSRDNVIQTRKILVQIRIADGVDLALVRILAVLCIDTQRSVHTVLYAVRRENKLNFLKVQKKKKKKKKSRINHLHFFSDSVSLSDHEHTIDNFPEWRESLCVQERVVDVVDEQLRGSGVWPSSGIHQGAWEIATT
jgi:hypothetical protein